MNITKKDFEKLKKIKISHIKESKKRKYKKINIKELLEKKSILI